MSALLCFKDWHVRIGFVCLVTGGLLMVALGHAQAQGPYSPVTSPELIKTKLNHYFTPDSKSHEPDFEWLFTKTEFVLKKGKGSIPADLQEKLLPLKTTADEIRGKWELEDKNGQQLLLTEIRAGDSGGKKEVRLPIYKTAPTVIRIGEPQYVFGIER